MTFAARTLADTPTLAKPVAHPVSATVAANSSGNNIPLSITGTFTSVAVSTNAGHGNAVASGTTIAYTPTPGYSGADAFDYTATNSAGTSSPALASITVTAPPTVVQILTTGSTNPWVCPTGVTSVTAYCFGEGGESNVNSISGAKFGGGGGAHANGVISTTPGSSYSFQIGAGGSSTKTWFASAATILADFGVNATTSAGGAGGSIANSIGTTRFAGGSGFTGGAGAGSGGAAGPNGAGGNGTSTAGGVGDAGSGGAGATSSSAAGNGAEFTDTSTAAKAGSGGGDYGSAAGNMLGGLYGAGGSSSIFGSSNPGVIVLVYS